MGSVRVGVGLVAVVALSCAPRAAAPAVTDDLAIALARDLAAACPITNEGDRAARAECATRLAELPALRDRMVEPFLWGGQKSSTTLLEETKTTRFNPLVWRRMYLSLEMFSGPYRIEHAGRRTILHMASTFRSALDPGEYPYPFWHSTAKWESYELAIETLFVIEDGKLVGALRSAEQDRSRPTIARAFDGDWDWGARTPVVLYQRLFSHDNPWVAPLDEAFRAFEAEARPYNCNGCHRPDNTADQHQLEMICYPNQALASRHTIVRAIEDKRMPPAGGVTDDTARARLLELARRFETTADAALAVEAARR